MVDRSDDNRAEYNGNKNTGKLVVPNKDMEVTVSNGYRALGPSVSVSIYLASRIYSTLSLWITSGTTRSGIPQTSTVRTIRNRKVLSFFLSKI